MDDPRNPSLSPMDLSPTNVVSPHREMPLGQVEEASPPGELPYSENHLQHHELPSHDDDEATREVFCSVLTTVIDYCMMSPTPSFEPNEYQLNQKQQSAISTDFAGMVGLPKPIKVPVLRIFGPILRRAGSIHKEAVELVPTNRPCQSACLYIHGAYPYLLARPVRAGMDGIHPECSWNSVAAVQRMLPALQEALEVAIQETNASLMDTKTAASKDSQPTTKSTAPPRTPGTRTIRALTVVTGRGFYGYCSGPVAPFVRVEYYGPPDRWKIKRCLERGLDVAPTFFPHHAMDDDDRLSFHCFEAHIPYTMQFFKDFNLAGMSYLHVTKPNTGNEAVYFRHPLPSSIRPQPNERISGSSAASSSEIRPWAFLASNTSDLYMWQDAEAKLSKRTTSCDVELDISVVSIANRFDIMTRLPSQDRLRVHWRAVPSLREIWNQERRRMAKLLPPKEDFLSGPEETSPSTMHHTPPFTLNVKEEDQVLPGAKLAREGMKRLLHVTDGLEDCFRRAMKQIVDRHAASIQEADNAAMLRDTAFAPTPLKRSAETNIAEKDHEIGRDAKGLTPSYEETLEALDALGNLVFKLPEETLDFRTDDISLQASRRSMSQESVPSFSSQTPVHTSQKSQSLAHNLRTTLSQSCSVSPNEKMNDPMHEYELSQRVERGDGLVGGQIENIDDVIDPETLVPYEIFDDEDDDGSSDDENDEDHELKEDKMVQLLSTLATQIDTRTDAPEEDSSIDSFEIMTRYGASDLGASLEPENVCHHSIEIPDTNRLHSMESISTNIEKSIHIESFPSWVHAANVRIEPRGLPPSRGGVINPSDQKFSNVIPSGRASYESLRRGLLEAHEFLPKNLTGFEVAPVRCAPTQKSVASWYKKRRKRQQGANSNDTAIRKRICRASLQRNGDARRKQSAESSSSCMALKFQENENSVEEVEWKNSQDSADACSQEYTEHNVKVKGKSDAALSQSCTSCSGGSVHDSASSPNDLPLTNQALQGIGNQGGRIFIEGGGNLKAKTKHSQYRDENFLEFNDTLQCPVSMMAIEIFIQCRVGQAGISDSRSIAMTPDPLRDKISAIFYVISEDPGGGDSLKYLERGCLFIPVSRELDALGGGDSSNLNRFASNVRKSMPTSTLGTSATLVIECVRDERQLLLRLASIVRRKDPDMLLSWDTQASGLGYIIERGLVIGKASAESPEPVRELDMSRLLGRTPTKATNSDSNIMNRLFDDAAESDVVLADIERSTSNVSAAGPSSSNRWTGSGLGSDWDERVGAGAAAASITGRLVFSAWKIIADEVKHPNCKYLPGVVFSVLNHRIPYHDNLKLTEWYGFEQGRDRWRVIHNGITQAVVCLKLFDALDIVGRSGEAARLSGVEFSQSFPGIRGSQYKVEGVLLRSLQSLNSDERGSREGRRRPSQHFSEQDGLTKENKSQTQSPWKARRHANFQRLDEDSESPFHHNLADRCYFFFSPSLRDTNRQEALEKQALTLEPLSGHQHDPVVVCDFTALYPSLVIAYNLCYSTIAGRLEYHTTRNEMRLEGKTTGHIGPLQYEEEMTATVLRHHIKSLRSGELEHLDRAYVTPTGSIYVSETVVKGVLPQVLDEILSTRAMLKKAAKQYKKHVPNLSPAILRQLEARQLALKYVANVTYGYTSATFSGRCAMPLLADTIVECGRRTLTNAINLANKWGQDKSCRWTGSKVIYGDTDSLFIVLPGRTVKEAFQFGEEFCKAVTDGNPPPVQLKLEKVYYGSMMQTKKKYCGMKFESKDQQTPVFEGKGLETVRRDQCLLTKKVLRNSLVMLYRHGIEAVKSYVFRQWALILAGKLPVSDFILTGRVRSRYRGGKIGPVQAALARRLAEADPAKVIRHKERQAYVIVATPGLVFKLRDCVLTPMELLEQWDAYTIHSAYYITKHVNAALQRSLGLAPYFINIATWYEACPKPRHRIHFWPTTKSRQSNMMISSFFGSDKCSLCGKKCKATSRSKAAVCTDCKSYQTKSIVSAMQRLSTTQNDALALAFQCSNCNLCFEDANTFATVRSAKSKPQSEMAPKVAQSTLLVTPLANCSCIDCPLTFARHRTREKELEGIAMCNTLDVL